MDLQPAGLTTATNTFAEKTAKLMALADCRRRPGAGSRLEGFSRDYRHVEEFHGGYYDNHPWVSPWTISACHVDSDLMLIGQDWASEDFLMQPPDAHLRDLGHDPDLPTNRNLKRLLSDAFGRGFEDTFATNAFAFAKPGGMNTRIPEPDLKRSAALYTLKEIEIIRPKLVICIGIGTFNALRLAVGHRPVRLETIDYNAAALTCCGSEVHGVPHVGARGLSATGGYARSREIWGGLSDRLG